MLALVSAYGQQMTYPSWTQFSAHMQEPHCHEVWTNSTASGPSVFASSTTEDLICKENQELDCHLFSDSILILHKMALTEKFLDFTLILQYGKSHLLP